MKSGKYIDQSDKNKYLDIIFVEETVLIPKIKETAGRKQQHEDKNDIQLVVQLPVPISFIPVEQRSHQKDTRPRDYLSDMTKEAQPNAPRNECITFCEPYLPAHAPAVIFWLQANATALQPGRGGRIEKPPEERRAFKRKDNKPNKGRWE